MFIPILKCLNRSKKERGSLTAHVADDAQDGIFRALFKKRQLQPERLSWHRFVEALPQKIFRSNESEWSLTKSFTKMFKTKMFKALWRHLLALKGTPPVTLIVGRILYLVVPNLTRFWRIMNSLTVYFFTQKNGQPSPFCRHRGCPETQL